MDPISQKLRLDTNLKGETDDTFLYRNVKFFFRSMMVNQFNKSLFCCRTQIIIGKLIQITSKRIPAYISIIGIFVH